MDLDEHAASRHRFAMLGAAQFLLKAAHDAALWQDTLKADECINAALKALDAYFAITTTWPGDGAPDEGGGEQVPSEQASRVDQGPGWYAHGHTLFVVPGGDDGT